MTTATEEAVAFTASSVRSQLEDRKIRSVNLPLAEIQPNFSDEDDPFILCDEEELNLAGEAYRNFMRTLQVPTKYFNRVSADLQKQILDYHLGQLEDKTLFALVAGDRIIGFGNDRKPIVPSARAFDAVNEVVQDRFGGLLSIRDVDINQYGVAVAWTTDALTVAPREGDITEGGVLLKLPEDGRADPEISLYANRLVCANGMTRQVQGQKFHMLGREVDDVLEELAAAAERVTDAVEDTLLKPFAGMDREVVDDPMARALGIARSHKLSKKLQQAFTLTVQAEMAKDSTQQREVTMYDLVNWLTQLGSPKLNPNADFDMRMRMAAVGGEEINFHTMRCASCHSVVK